MIAALLYDSLDSPVSPLVGVTLILLIFGKPWHRRFILTGLACLAVVAGIVWTAVAVT